MMVRTSANLDDLSILWSKVVTSGGLTNEFSAPDSDPEGGWKSGDRILFGINHSDRGFYYFAKNLNTDKVINAVVEEKEISGTEFRCQLNRWRALKPSVLTVGRQPEVSTNPSDCGFYCQDPTNTLSFLRRTPLAQLTLKNYVWCAFYNALPLEIEGHFIWVPVRIRDTHLTLPHHLQILSRSIIEDLFLLCEQSKNFVLFFNSLHAGASVNHLHLHTVFRRYPFAIEKQRPASWGRFYLLDSYPSEGLVFQGIQSVDLLCETVMRLQEIGIPFNLIWLDERVFLVPRNIEHEVTEEFPFDPLSAMDLCGKIVTTDKRTYDSTTKESIEAALRKSTVAAGEFLRDLIFC